MRDAVLRGRDLCSSEDPHVQAQQSLGTRFETGEEDRPSGPDFADTSQVTHRDYWITTFGV